MISPMKNGNILLAIGTILMTICVILMGCFGLIFTSMLNKMLIIDPEAKVFTNFDSPTVPIYMDFYIFNVTNPEEVQHYGLKPKLVEMGPYSYLEKLQKQNYVWNDGEGTVSYKQTKTYFFDEKRSKGKLSDQVTTLNSVMVVLGSRIHGLNSALKAAAELFFLRFNLNENLFIRKSVSELLFEGYYDPLVEMVGQVTGDPIKIEGKFGFYYKLVGALTFEIKLITEIIWPEIESGMDLFQTITVDQMLFTGFDLPLFDFRIDYFNKTHDLNGSVYDILDQVGLGAQASFLEPNKFGYYYESAAEYSDKRVFDICIIPLGIPYMLGRRKKFSIVERFLTVVDCLHLYEKNLTEKNQTDNGLFKVKTGALGMKDYLYIQEWKNSDTVDYWNDPYCNMINGTDGTQFPPGVHRDSTIRLFNTDMCRSLYLEYDKDTMVVDTVPTYRYLAPVEMLESPKSNPDNECFCTILPNDDGCLNDGMMNMQKCLHVPLVLSTPHFYQGDPEDINKVDGLNPQKDLHETYLDIEPTTGVVMEAAKRIQLNLPLKRYGHLPSFMNVPDLIFPVFWASENAQIPKDTAQSLNKALTLPYLVAYVIGGVILVLSLVLVGVGIFKIKKKQSSPKGATLMKK